MKASEFTFSVELAPGEWLSLPPAVVDTIGPGRWQIRICPADAPSKQLRGHRAFLNGYNPEDEALHDDVRAAR